ncbi:MAG: efflux RND transporter periplasmic adaptor subunit [Gemmatimonadaceae bacterium]|nr:efflux RND transporter periplasmic adaptor subunit [Gemmatimonadaceae bacterium]
MSASFAASRTMLGVLAAAFTLSACGSDSASTSQDSARASSASDSLSPTAAGNTTNTPLVLGARDLAVVVEQPLRAGIEVTGSLDPAERVEVKAQIAGQLARVTVERGTAVRRGQALTSFESGALRAQVASAQAAVAARARDLEAIDTLYKRGAASQQDFVNARAARDAAEAQLAQVRETLERATVLAPIGGQVSEKLVSTGEAVQSGAHLFTIVNSDVLELAGQMAAADAAQVRVGQRVLLTLDAYPGREVQGRVDRIDPVANPATRQVTAYIRVQNTRDPVVAGLFATGRILTGQSTAAASAQASSLAVPSGAVRAEGRDTVVYVVADGRVQRRLVSVGARDAFTGLSEVRSGLRAGERVLIAPGAAPRDGAAVQVVSPAVVPPTGASPADSAMPTSTGSRS